MTSVTRLQKIYFAAVGLLALWVGLWGYFAPGQVDRAIPWLVPPLHARFIGAIYLSATVFMLGCLLARRYTEVRVVVVMVGIWTGLLCVVSLFYLGEFDYTRPQVWIWFGAYILYPLIALWLTWQHRNLKDEAVGPRLSVWVRGFLLVGGLTLTLLALALLWVPGVVISLWPWKITQLLAQIYSAPFLAYGVGCLLLSRQRTWPEVWVAVSATFVFAVGVLLASLIHLALFSITNPIAWIWFGSFLFTSVIFGLLTLRAVLARVSI